MTSAPAAAFEQTRTARVYKNDGTKMDNLYAIGNAAGNVFGGVYPGPGATIGQGITLGYAAVDDILDRQ